MPNFLDRYRAGEHEQVWRELCALGDAVRTEPLLSDAMAVARETAARARRNVELLVPRLEVIGYQFGYFYEGDPIPDYSGPLSQPPADITSQIDTLEGLIGSFPLSLRAWYETIGAVDFRGYHPAWKAYYPDSLMVFGLEFQNRVDQHNDLNGRRGREIDNEASAFEYFVSLDLVFKTNASGGPPYVIILPCGAADASLEDELHHTTFIDYIRICFRWGGFPGLDPGIPGVDSTQHIAFLTESLLEL